MYKGFEMDVTVESGDTEQKGGRDKASLSKASSVPSSHSNSVKYMSSSDSFL